MNESTTIADYLKSKNKGYEVKVFSSKAPSPYVMVMSGIKKKKLSDETVVELVKKLVCEHYNIEFESIDIVGQKREIVEIRQVIMALIKKHTSLSLKAIGKTFKGKSGSGYDHSTVIWGVWQIDNLIPQSRALKTAWDTINAKIYALK